MVDEFFRRLERWTSHLSDDTVIYHNPIRQWVLAIGLFVLIAVMLRMVNGLVRRRADQRAQRLPYRLFSLVVTLADETRRWFLLIVAAYFASLVLTMPEKARSLVQAIAIAALILQGAIWGSRLITYFIERNARQKLQSDAETVTTLAAVGFLAKVVLWSVALLLILSNIGVDVTALVAGLGVGGIAVALAAQNILGDLFASLSIVLDKPFVLGDAINVGGDSGTVEKIGWKTTHVRATSGEQIIFSNADLLKSRIRNFKRMAERRVAFTIGVTYRTPPEKAEAIPGLIRAAIEAREKVRFDRAHFQKLGDSALIYEAVYFVTISDYGLFMDIQQAINLTLLRQFAAEGIEFAYPTQTLIVERGGKSTEDESAG